MRILINLLWYYPAVIMTVWTLLVFFLARTTKLGLPVPLFGNAHGMLFMLNPKDSNLYQRPSALAAGGFLVLGLIPIVNALLLVAHLAYVAIVVQSSLARSKSKKST